MKRVRTALLLAALGAGAFGEGMAVPPALAGDPNQPVDRECLKAIRDDAGHGRRQGALYIDEMNRFENNVRAANGISVCRGAMRRAETYIARHEEDGVICTIGSSYVDRQISQLFKSAVTSCRDEFRSVLQTLPLEEQEPVIQRVRQREAEMRATPLPRPVEQP